MSEEVEITYFYEVIIEELPEHLQELISLDVAQSDGLKIKSIRLEIDLG